MSCGRFREGMLTGCGWFCNSVSIGVGGDCASAG